MKTFVTFVVCAVAFQLMQTDAAPRQKRWIPERYSDADYGMDAGFVPSGPTYESSNNNPNQNYMSYYWPEYFSNSRGDYNGMYRAGGGSDNPAHVMMADPVQQLQNVNAYSYAQSYPQSLPMTNYDPYGRTHSTEHEGRAGLLSGLLGVGHSSQQPISHSSQTPATSKFILVQTQPNIQQSFPVALSTSHQGFESQQDLILNENAMLLNAMQNSQPSLFTFSQPANQASALQLSLLDNNLAFQQSNSDSNTNLGDFIVVNNNNPLNSHSLLHNTDQELLALHALGGSQQLAFSNNFNQFSSSPQIVALTHNQLLALTKQSTPNENAFSVVTLNQPTHSNAKKIVFTSNSGLSNQDLINAVSAHQPQTFTNNDAILVSTSAANKENALVQENILEKAILQAEIAQIQGAQNAIQVKSDQKSPVVVVVSDHSNPQENNLAESIVIQEEISKAVQNTHSSSPLASQKHTISQETLKAAIEQALAMRKESPNHHIEAVIVGQKQVSAPAQLQPTVLKLDATDNIQGHPQLLIAASQNGNNAALEEAILEEGMLQTAIAQANENQVMEALAQNINVEQQKETMKEMAQTVNEQQQQAATKTEPANPLVQLNIASRADAYKNPISSYQAPSNYPKANYQDPGVPTSPLDTVYPGVSSVVSLPSRGLAPMSFYQPQSQYTSSPSPYLQSSPIYDLSQQYSLPYSSPVSNYGQMIQPLRYGYGSVPSNSNVYAPYASQAISSPVYNSGSGYYAVPRMVRSSVIPQPQPVVRYVYGVQQQVPANVVG